MRKTDDAEAMRRRAHEIWVREGCPNGREHEHWAEAARELAAEDDAPAMSVEVERDVVEEDGEIARLRRALYEPEAYSVELLDDETSVPPTKRIRDS